MITLTAAQKRYLLDDDYRVEMEVNTVNEDEFTITETNLVQGSFAANRFSCVGNTIEVGSANAAEIALTLRNDDGTFDSVVFEGAQVIVWLRRGTSGSYTLNLRLFTARVDEVHHAIDSIQLVLLDSMVKLDKTAANLTYNTPQGVIQQICSACGITYNSAKSSLVNGTVQLATPTTENLSYRQVLMWIAQITGTCAFFDPEDKLVLNLYTMSTNQEIDYIKKSNRFSSDLDENEIMVTGVSVTVGETVYSDKDDSADVDYLISIEGNELISAENVETILSGLANRLIGFSYTPFSATTMNLCWLLPLDMTEFWDKDDNPHDVIITDWTFTPHSSLQLAGKGESATKKGYASNPPFTAQQSRIIEKLKRGVENVDVDDRITAVLGLNDAINHGMMLHTTTVDGKEYRHNAALLEDSTYICTANDGGFAWTNSGWNDGEPVWEYGISSDGSAVLEQLSAYAISADVVSTGILQSTDGSTTLDMNNGTASFFNGALLYDSANGFRFGTNVTFGRSNLGQDVIDLIEQGSDGIDVHGTAGTRSGTKYPVTTEEKPSELVVGMTIKIHFPDGLYFSNTSSGYSALYVTLDNIAPTYIYLRNANNTTWFCNVKDPSDYNSACDIVFVVRSVDSSSAMICEAIFEEDVQDATLITSGSPSTLQLQTLLTNPKPGTVLKCDYSALTYGLGFYNTVQSTSNLSSPTLRFQTSDSTYRPILARNQYNANKYIASAYGSSELESKGSAAGSADYSGTSSTAAATASKQVNISASGVIPSDGFTLLVTFTYANTADYIELYSTNNPGIYQMVFDPDTGTNMKASSAYNWSAGQSRLFTWNNNRWYIGFVPVTYYYSPKEKTSVYLIFENLKTDSNAAVLRAFELKDKPLLPQSTPDYEARELADAAQVAADAALVAAQAAQGAVDTLDSDVDTRISSAIAGITVEGTITTFYGTCSTSAGTASKIVYIYKSDGSTLDDSFTLKKGAIINVSFTNANTATTPTLNVNNTGAKAIYVNNAQLHYGSSYTTNAYNWKANTVVQFMYDGSYWRMSQTSADLILANWCADTNMTVIDGSKIYAGAVTTKKIQANSIYATDALLGNLLACNATITGLIDCKASATTTQPSNDDLDAVCNALYGTSYNSASSFVKVIVSAYASIFKNAFKSKLRVGFVSDNTYNPSLFLTPMGMIVGTGQEALTESNFLQDIFTNNKLGWYGANAFVPGLLNVKGHLSLKESGIEEMTIEANDTLALKTISFSTAFNKVPNIQLTMQGTSYQPFVRVQSVSKTQLQIAAYTTNVYTYDIGIKVHWMATGQ